MILKKLYLKTIYKVILRRKVLNYLKAKGSLAKDEREVQEFLEKNSCHTYPYEFTKKYKMGDIKIFTDKSCGLRYVFNSDGKRLYFKKSWNKGQIQRCYKNMLLEQDELSPHRYLTPYFMVCKEDNVMDIGCADANFSLSIIDKINHLYLFEVDSEWIEALKITFKAWSDKVTIINRFVSDIDNDTNITIDKFVEQNKVTFIKADIEGNELLVLRGGKEFLASGGPIKIAITTYHKQEHASQIYDILNGSGFACKFSRGFMILKSQGGLTAPYLRRGLIYAVK